jgi:hypothetical protein
MCIGSCVAITSRRRAASTPWTSLSYVGPGWMCAYRRARFYETFRVARGETVDRSLFVLASRQWDNPGRSSARLIPSLPRIRIRSRGRVSSQGLRTMLVSARRLPTITAQAFDCFRGRHPTGAARTSKKTFYSPKLAIECETFRIVRSLASHMEVEGRSAEQFRGSWDA